MTERGKIKDTDEHFELCMLVSFLFKHYLRSPLLMLVPEKGKIKRADYQKHSPKMI